MAAATGYGQRWITEIVRRYNAEGTGGLGDQRANNTGARPLLSQEDELTLQEALAEPPADGGLWSGPKVAAWMTARLGRKIWPQRGWDYLQKLGYSSQMPARGTLRRRARRSRKPSKGAREAGGRAPH